jgi:3-phosphoshikimate 1-carboxyvinyltransferase
MFSIPFLDLPPLQAASGTVRIPGSKSISNRVLLLSGLCQGETLIHGLLASDDTSVMQNALRALGCTITVDASSGATHVRGLGGRLSVRRADLFLGNAGTAMRPLVAALAALVAAEGGEFELRGTPRMHERPIADLVEALAPLGCRIEYLGAAGFPPLRLTANAPSIATAPETQTLRVRGDVSSQFLTGLLMALPILARETNVVVEVDGELISKPYIAITLSLLQQFGIRVEREGWQSFRVAKGAQYRSPGEVRVEGDASSASYFVALGAIAATSGAVRIEGVGLDSIQGDIAFVEAARSMGADVQGGAGWLEVRRGQFPLRAMHRDCTDIPDAAMTLAAMALFADGTSRLDGIGSWRVKETDRIAAMATELSKLGARVDEGEDFLAITPPAVWRDADIRTYDDHRMAMCLSLSAFSQVARGGQAIALRIDDPGCVAKTFPDYFEAFFNAARTDGANIPVITIDGPSGSGKGTLASAVAQKLGYHFLDSGLVYRAVALLSLRHGISADDATALARIAADLHLEFDASGQALLDGENVTDTLRSEAVGAVASKISVWPEVRSELLAAQLRFRALPGLVADGRDMGSVVFPNAKLKVYLTASARTRAERRYNQLISKGFQANIDSLHADLMQRDARDQSRSTAPLAIAEDALLLDNSALSIDDSVKWVLDAWQSRWPFGKSHSA